MNPIEVTARMTADGKIIPQQVQIDGSFVPIMDIGRRWQDERGKHILVRIPPQKVLHLVYSGQGWFIQDILGSPKQQAS